MLVSFGLICFELKVSLLIEDIGWAVHRIVPRLTKVLGAALATLLELFLVPPLFILPTIVLQDSDFQVLFKDGDLVEDLILQL